MSCYMIFEDVAKSLKNRNDRFISTTVVLSKILIIYYNYNYNTHRMD